jgi:hypothetical protein
MPSWSLRHLVEAAIPRAGSPWGVTAEHYEVVREIADRARAETGLTLARASDFCAALRIRFRQSLLPSAPGDSCRLDGLIFYGRDLQVAEREMVLLHGVAHRLLGAQHRPVEFFAWLLALELAVPRELLSHLGFDRFVEHHGHVPVWSIELVALLYEIRLPLASDHYTLDEAGPDSATSSKNKP